jgi:hypothetical protein
MIPNFDVFRNGIDFHTIAIAVKNQFENITVSTAFPGDFATHHMRCTRTVSRAQNEHYQKETQTHSVKTKN